MRGSIGYHPRQNLKLCPKRRLQVQKVVDRYQRNINKNGINPPNIEYVSYTQIFVSHCKYLIQAGTRRIMLASLLVFNLSKISTEQKPHISIIEYHAVPYVIVLFFLRIFPYTWDNYAVKRYLIVFRRPKIVVFSSFELCIVQMHPAKFFTFVIHITKL